MRWKRSDYVGLMVATVITNLPLFAFIALYEVEREPESLPLGPETVWFPACFAAGLGVISSLMACIHADVDTRCWQTHAGVACIVAVFFAPAILWSGFWFSK